MGRIILCIDDQPVRYRKLRKMVQNLECVVVTTCRLDDFMEYMKGPDEIIGVCLDHDMPFQNGDYFAFHLREKNYPVVITSMNPQGAQAMMQILDNYETPNKYLPCNLPWENLALEFWGLV